MPLNAVPRRPTICVFCGSSFGNDPAYAQAARRFGTLLVEHGYGLVFGGGGVGLMGETALSVAEAKGRILGIVPRFLRHLEPPLSVPSEIVVTDSMSERKNRMFAAADSYAVLPGGLGTMDEFFEVFTDAQLHQHVKPIVLVNVKGYWNALIALIDHMIAEGFVRAENKDLIHVADTPEDAIRIFDEARAKAASA